MAGYVENRGKDSWRLTVVIGYDANDKKIYRRKTIKAKNKKEAKAELAKFVVEIEAGEYIAPEKMLFSAFVSEWREKYAVKHLSAGTLQTYEGHLKLRILPVFGHMRLEQIKTMHIVTFLEALGKDGTRQDGKKGSLSPATVQYIHRVLKNILNRAVEWKMIKRNPMESVKRPVVTQQENDVYNEAEAERLFAALENEPFMWRIMITLALTTGMRRGELLGLEWEHVDLENGTIQVKQSLTYVKGEFIIKEPKTRNSKRLISLPEFVLEAIKAYKLYANKQRLKAAELWAGGERFFLFTSWHGKPLHPSSVTTWWRRFIEKHKLRYIRFHDLRHTSATLLINKGVHAKLISSRLGHADIRTTMNVYGHVLQTADKEAANHFDSLLQGRSFNEKQA